MMRKQYIALVLFLMFGLATVACAANERKVDAGYVQFKGQATANTPASGFYNFYIDSDDDVPRYRNSAGNYIDTLMTSFAQTVTGLKSFDVGVAMKEITTPSNPSATYYKLYFKSDGNLYKLNSAGSEVAFSTGGSSCNTVAVTTYTTAGSNTFTCPTGAIGGTFDIAAGGGGGSSGYDNGSTRNGGAGGGGGAFASIPFNCVASSTYTVTVGAGGAGGVNSGAGGQTGSVGGDSFISTGGTEIIRVGGGQVSNSGTGGSLMTGGAAYFNGGAGGAGGATSSSGSAGSRLFYGVSPGTAGTGGSPNGAFAGGGGGGASIFGSTGGNGSSSGGGCTAGTRGGGGGGSQAGSSGSGNGCAGGAGWVQVRVCTL